MLEEKDYQSLDIIFSFLSLFSDRSTEYGKTASMEMMHTRKTVFADITGDLFQPAC